MNNLYCLTILEARLISSDMDAILYSCNPMALPRWCLLLIIVVVVFPPQVFSQLTNICGTKANGRYACPDCSTSTTATLNHSAGFEANLLRLRASLQQMAAANASFLNATFATGSGDTEDTIYGLAMCFADTERPDCAPCLTDAAAELAGTRCAGRRDMIIWYVHCLVRYDDDAFFGTADISPAQRFDVPNPNNFSDSARLGMVRQRLAARVLAAAATSTLWFAFDAEEVAANATLHGLAQCTLDLPAEECNRCLASHMAWLTGCCADMDGVRLNGPSCYVRYEFMGFVPSMSPSMAPLLPPAPASVPGITPPERKKKARIYILAGTLVHCCASFFSLHSFAARMSAMAHFLPCPGRTGSGRETRQRSNPSCGGNIRGGTASRK